MVKWLREPTDAAALGGTRETGITYCEKEYSRSALLGGTTNSGHRTSVSSMLFQMIVWGQFDRVSGLVALEDLELLIHASTTIHQLFDQKPHRPMNSLLPGSIGSRRARWRGKGCIKELLLVNIHTFMPQMLVMQENGMHRVDSMNKL